MTSVSRVDTAFMSVRGAARLTLSLSIALAMASVLLGGAVSPLAVVAVPLAIAPIYWPRMRIGGALAVVFGVSLLVFALIRLQVTSVGGVVVAGTELVLGFLCLRMVTHAGQREEQQALMLSLVVLAAGAVQNQALAFGAIFVLYALCTAWALLFVHLGGIGSPPNNTVTVNTDSQLTVLTRRSVTPRLLGATGIIALVSLLLAATLFVAIPRFSFGAFGGALGRKSALPFTGSLREGGAGGGFSDAIARVTGVSADAFDTGLYLRAAVYEQLKTDGFTRDLDAERGTRRLTFNRLQDATQTYEVQMLSDLGVLPMLGPFVELALLGERAVPMRLDDLGEVSLIGARGPVRYRVRGDLTQPIEHLAPSAEQVHSIARHLDRTDPEPARLRALQIPENLDPRVVSLATNSTTTAESSRDKVRQIAQLLAGYGYANDAVTAAAKDPLASFLFEVRRGNCQHFALATAVLLRVVGVPARVVGGFQGGEWIDDGGIVFRGNHAHAWVEFFDPATGWHLVDTTPAAPGPSQASQVGSWWFRLQRLWDDSIVDFSAADQLTALTRASTATRDLRATLKAFVAALRARPWWIAAGVVVIAVLLTVAWRFLRSMRVVRDVDTAYAPLSQALQELAEATDDLPTRSNATVQSLTARALMRLPADAQPVVVDAARALEHALYGGQRLRARDIAQHAARLRQLEKRLVPVR